MDWDYFEEVIIMPTIRITIITRSISILNRPSIRIIIPNADYIRIELARYLLTMINAIPSRYMSSMTFPSKARGICKLLRMTRIIAQTSKTACRCNEVNISNIQVVIIEYYTWDNHKSMKYLPLLVIMQEFAITFHTFSPGIKRSGQ